MGVILLELKGEKLMSNQFAAITLISDLTTVRHYCHRTGIDKIPDVAKDYLVVNYNLIQSFFASVTSNTTDIEREELYENHRELDSSAISSSFYQMVGRMVDQAKRHGRRIVILEDDVHMILRALEYAKYCSHGTVAIVLPEMSPIVKWLE